MQKSQQNQQLPLTNAFKIEIKKRHGALEAKNARLQISDGGARFEGERFKALADFCRRRYENTTVIVSDTLQRHNTAAPVASWEASRRAGDEWLERNKEALQGFKIVRWDDFLTSPDFQRELQNIRSLTSQGAAQAALNAISFEFNRRRSVPINQCQDFLLEELTAFAMMFPEPAVDIYPGQWITPLIANTPHPSFNYNKIRCLSVEPTHMKLDLTKVA